MILAETAGRFPIVEGVAATALIAALWAFLRYLKERDKSEREERDHREAVAAAERERLHETFKATLRDLGETQRAALQHVTDSHKASEERNAHALDKLAENIQGMASNLEGQRVAIHELLDEIRQDRKAS